MGNSFQQYMAASEKQAIFYARRKRQPLCKVSVYKTASGPPLQYQLPGESRDLETGGLAGLGRGHMEMRLITACSGKEAGGLIVMMQIKASSYIVKKTWQKNLTLHTGLQSSPKKTLPFLPPTHPMSTHWPLLPSALSGHRTAEQQKGRSA